MQMPTYLTHENNSTTHHHVDFSMAHNHRHFNFSAATLAIVVGRKTGAGVGCTNGSAEISK
jgi:hypothetical protein